MPKSFAFFVTDDIQLIYQYSILVIENFDAKKFYIKYKITIILELKILRKKLICLLRYEDQMELIDQLFYCQSKYQTDHGYYYIQFYNHFLILIINQS